jgi:hypothetical protein
VNQPWLDELKITIINKEYEKLDELCTNMPHFSGIEETIEAQALIKEALRLVKDEKDKTGEFMKKIKKQSAFLSIAEDSTKFSLSS